MENQNRKRIQRIIKMKKEKAIREPQWLRSHTQDKKSLVRIQGNKISLLLEQTNLDRKNL